MTTVWIVAASIIACIILLGIAATLLWRLDPEHVAGLALERAKKEHLPPSRMSFAFTSIAAGAIIIVCSVALTWVYHPVAFIDTNPVRPPSIAFLKGAKVNLMEFAYEQYTRIFRSLILDELNDEGLQELNRMRENAGVIQNLTAAREEEPRAIEIDRMVLAVGKYKARNFDESLFHVNSVTPRVPTKYRMLISINSQLLKLHRSEPREAQRYLAALKESATQYYELSGPASPLANFLLAIAYKREAEVSGFDRAEKQSRYAEAIRLFRTAEELDPGAASVNYNLAASYVAVNNLDGAVEELRTAKTKGDLRKPTDINFFNNDRDFDKLRDSRGQQVELLLTKF